MACGYRGSNDPAAKRYTTRDLGRSGSGPFLQEKESIRRFSPRRGDQAWCNSAAEVAVHFAGIEFCATLIS
jgi:hypothetical protein